ncbi:MAG: SCO family protein [Candidatus Hydrogenedentes bacterium]|nr:SCO family protein [Candidatus Hydrogenedentota bacterium]
MKSRRIVLVLAMGAILIALSVAPLFAQRVFEPPLPVIAKAPEFELTDSTEAHFSSAALRGKVWVADFIFTRCGGACPVMTAELARLDKEFSTSEDFALVSISVDPEYDTPEILREFGERYGAVPGRWHFLTGDADTIAGLSVEGFKVGSLDSPMNHSQRFILVDRRGRIRGYYSSTDAEDLARLRADLRALLKD